MATRSPRRTPKPFRTFANLLTSACNSPYVIRLTSPAGSPSQISATRPLRPVSFRVPPGALVRRGVAHMGLSFEGVRGSETPLLVEESFDPVSRHASGY